MGRVGIAPVDPRLRNSGVMTFIHHLPRTNSPVSYRYVWAEDQWMIVVESGEPPPGERLDARRSPDALGVDSKGPWRIRSTSEAGDLSLTRFSMASAEEQERRMWGLRERILFIRTFGLVGVDPEDLLWHGPKAEFQSRQIPGFAVISTNSIGAVPAPDNSTSCNINVCNVNNCTLGPHFMGTTDQGFRNIVVQVTPPYAGSMTDKYQLPRCTYVCQAVCGVCGQQIQQTKIGDVQMQASNQYCP
jgi:hypothetical protein